MSGNEGHDGHDWFGDSQTKDDSVAGPGDRRRHWPIVVVALLVLAGLVAGGVVGYQQNGVAAQWRERDHQAIAHNSALTKSLSSANASIESLNGTVSDLRSQVTKLQGRLSSVADAKEKALDQNTVLGRLNSEADAVSQQLSTCVDEMNSFLSELATDLDNGVYDPNLDATASQAHVDCASAQTDNDELQITLGGVG